MDTALRGSGDSLLRAGVLRDLLHDLAVALIPHDLMISTKLEKGAPHHLLCQVWRFSALRTPAGYVHSSLGNQGTELEGSTPQCFRTDLQEGAEHVQFTLALQRGVSHEPHNSCRKEPSCSGPPCLKPPIPRGPHSPFLLWEPAFETVRGSHSLQSASGLEKRQPRREVINTGHTVLHPTHLQTCQPPSC